MNSNGDDGWPPVVLVPAARLHWLFQSLQCCCHCSTANAVARPATVGRSQPGTMVDIICANHHRKNFGKDSSLHWWPVQRKIQGH